MISRLWTLPRPRLTGFKDADIGGFPLFFEKKLSELLGSVDVLQPFGGRGEIGLRVDLRKSVRPDVLADAHFLPFRGESFDVVLLDPPFSDELAVSLFGINRKLERSVFLDEAVRVSRRFVCAYHLLWIPRPEQTNYFAKIVVLLGRNHQARICMVYEKSARAPIQRSLDQLV